MTADVGDFRTLAAARELHAGIVLLLDGGLRRDEHFEVLRGVIVTLEADGDLVNLALTAAINGGFMLANRSSTSSRASPSFRSGRPLARGFCADANP